LESPVGIEIVGIGTQVLDWKQDCESEDLKADIDAEDRESAV
jgi:hypothetical protein